MSVVAPSAAPRRAGLVLVTLILVAAVANLNLSVANVALPSIGQAFDSSQVMLNLVAVGYSLGLAASVLYLGALGDRYGRKMMHPRSRGAGRALVSDLGARRFEPRRGKTLIVVDVIDQSHLHGVLARLQDFNIDIERVNPI